MIMEFLPPGTAPYWNEIKSDSQKRAKKITGSMHWPDAIKKSFIPEHFVNIGCCVT